MSDTPLTDKESHPEINNWPNNSVVSADFARHLERENICLRKSLTNVCREQLVDKDKEIMALRDTLEFYANDDNYKSALSEHKKGSMVIPVMEDKGEIARKTLW